MREQVLDPLGMKQSSYVWLPEFESRMAAGYDGQENRLDVQAAIGRRTLAIAQGMAESARRVALRGCGAGGTAGQSAVARASAVHGAQRGGVAAHHRERLRQVPDPRRGPASRRRRLDLKAATRSAMITPQVRLNSALSWGLGWGIQRDEHGEVLWHWGANNSFRNFVIADQRQRPASGRVHQQRERSPHLRTGDRGGHRARPSGLPLDLSRSTTS